MPKKRQPGGKVDGEFKLEAVEILLEEHRSGHEVSRWLDINEDPLHAWKRTCKGSGPAPFSGKIRRAWSIGAIFRGVNGCVDRRIYDMRACF
jgi:transposase-like protein